MNIADENSSAVSEVSINGEPAEKLPISQIVHKGDVVTLKANPVNDADYTFAGWTGATTSDQNEIQVTIDGNTNLTVSNNEIQRIDLALNSTVVTASSSNTNPAWAPDNLTDGQKFSSSDSMGYTSANTKTDTVNHWVQIDLGQDTAFDRIHLYPRTDVKTADGKTPSFPKDFTIEICKDGETEFTTITTETDYIAPEEKPAVFTFDQEQTARYLRLNVSKVGAPPNNEDYYLQLAELTVHNDNLPAVDKEDLKQAIDQAKEYKSEDYTQTSYQTLQDAIQSAEDCYANEEATLDQIYAAIQSINNAIANLKGINDPGTESNPYKISSVEELQIFAQRVNSGYSYQNEFVVLTQDLDLTGIHWTPIGTTTNAKSGIGFAGNFDGQRHIISNLNVPDSSNYATFGLFGMVNGTVKNLGIENATVLSGSVDCRSGSLAGTVMSGLVDNCYVVNSSVTATSRVAGGLVGQNYDGGIIRNSYAKNIAVTGGRVATLVGDNQEDGGSYKGLISNCYADADIVSGNTGNVENSQKMDASAFTNGEVVNLLNQGNPETVWVQGETHPIFAEYSVPVDKTALETLYNQVKDTDLSQYVDGDAKDTFVAELEKAKNLLANENSTQEEVDAAVISLQAAFDALEKKPVEPTDVDKDILNKVIAYAEEQKVSDDFNNVIKDVQESFNTALEAAKTVALDPSATQDAVDATWQALLDLKPHKLGFVKGDITSLQQLVSLAESYNMNDFVEAGQAEFQAALKAAQELIANKDNAMTNEIQVAETNLLNAMLNLRYKADKSILEKIIAEANDVDSSAYTAESYAVLQAAVAEANAVMTNENASQEEVNAAVVSVQEAMNGLVAVETPADNNNADGTQTGQESTTTKANAAKTGDVFPIAGVMVLALAGAAVVALKKEKIIVFLK